MTAKASQKQAIKNYRRRLAQRGLTRFEVMALAGDRDLIRCVAKRLARNDEQAASLRDTLAQSVSGMPSRRGGILAALRRSPALGEEIGPSRRGEPGRKVDL